MALSHQSVVRNSGSDPLKPDLPFLGIPLECLDVGELDLMGLWWAGQAGFSEDNLLNYREAFYKLLNLNILIQKSFHVYNKNNRIVGMQFNLGRRLTNLEIDELEALNACIVLDIVTVFIAI